MKLIKVMDGLYRSECGGVHVAKQIKWMGKNAHWTVKWTDVFSTRHVREFPTLKDVRQYLNEGKQP